MTNDAVREAILHAIIQCEIVPSNDDPYPAITDVRTAKELARGVFNGLKAKGFLIKMDDDD